MFLGDFHIHSRWSDGLLEVSEIVDLFGQRGFGAISITDHLCDSKSFMGKGARWIGRTLTQENFPDYLECLKEESKRAWKQYRMLLISGIELTFNSLKEDESWHILALGIKNYICPNLKPEEICQSIRMQGGLSIAAHPVDTRKKEKQTLYLWKQKEKFSKQIDAWEVASGNIMFEEVQKSGLNLIASSDFHGPKQMSSWKSVFHCEKSEEAIFDSIRRQKIDFEYFTNHPCEFLNNVRARRKNLKLSERLFDLSLAMF